MGTDRKTDEEANLLCLSIAEQLNEATNAVEIRDINKLYDIDLLVKRYFCKKIADHKLEALNEFNKLLVNFLAWFEWGGKPQWKEAASIVNNWKTILDLSQRTLLTESPLTAYKELKKSSYGRDLVFMLLDKKVMKPSEIKEALNMNSIQQASNLLSIFEKAGIVVREFRGKNVLVSLGKQGIAVYQEYIEPGTVSTELGQDIVAALKAYEIGDIANARKRLQTIKENTPSNPFVICLLGMIALENGELVEAGKLLVEAVKVGLDKIRVFMFFFLLEKIKKLDSLKKGIEKINFQEDKITPKVSPTLQMLGLLTEYLGRTDRANEYYRLSYVRY